MAALAEGGDLHEETAGLVEDQTVRKLAAWVGLGVLEHGGGRALQRDAGGRAGIDGIHEGDGDILRPLGAVQIFTFEMEDAIEGNDEVVAGELDGERAFCGKDDGAGSEGAEVVHAVDGEDGEGGLHAGFLVEYEVVRPIAGGGLFVYRVGGDVGDDQ